MKIYEKNEEEWGQKWRNKKRIIKKKQDEKKKTYLKLSSLCEVWKLRTKVWHGKFSWLWLTIGVDLLITWATWTNLINNLSVKVKIHLAITVGK